MKTAEEIYAEYRIMPSLQLHQLRVAAIAKRICGNLKHSANENEVLLACLFHDMGNIIKSDLRYFSEFVEPEGLEYWQRVKNDFVEKYGSDHHHANVAIAREIGLPARSIELIGNIGFSQLRKVAADDALDRKIVQYADIRVGPHGILSLRERLYEGRERYTETRNGRAYYETDTEFQQLLSAAEELERQVMALSTITAADITDAAIAPSIEQLRERAVA